MWKLEWTPEAEMQYYDILSYWTNHNKSNSYSIKIMNEVEKSEDLLIYNPFIGQEHYLSTPYFKIRSLLVLKNFSIIYRITDRIEILSFWDNRNDPAKLERLTL
ncbi:type II toxin-antitoxin system RelE/ParE family toxin [Capnocytophaga sp. oral taxon 336]|uniref:type II toxin-antitoxin system RelE/ParE family toxin n=1 Tax=Capnocytophaga sp. oral taxon 336 TaxID=712216 RepID=UPI00034EBEBF|nr:type II toxin-antitoxin system RelE/ParE family toxin [Capnocytophaga sp. oral taxon 336]EPE00382.1 hypothetical protein HMPREF1528_01309 [Capnocytophaga sp. oral taxon 336 str. F0502]